MPIAPPASIAITQLARRHHAWSAQAASGPEVDFADLAAVALDARLDGSADRLPSQRGCRSLLGPPRTGRKGSLLLAKAVPGVQRATRAYTQSRQHPKRIQVAPVIRAHMSAQMCWADLGPTMLAELEPEVAAYVPPDVAQDVPPDVRVSKTGSVRGSRGTFSLNPGPIGQRTVAT